MKEPEQCCSGSSCILNEKYVDLSVSIYIYRNNFIKKINEYISLKYYSISGDNGLVIKYINDIDIDNRNNMIKLE